MLQWDVNHIRESVDWKAMDRMCGVCTWVNWNRCLLEPLGSVAWITNRQTSTKRKLQAAVWCFRACRPWEGHSCFLRKCHFRFQQIGCETCKVFRFRSTSFSDFEAWEICGSHPVWVYFSLPPQEGTLWPSSYITLIVAQFAFPHFTPNGLLGSVYVLLMYTTHCASEWYSLFPFIYRMSFWNAKRNSLINRISNGLLLAFTILTSSMFSHI